MDLNDRLITQSMSVVKNNYASKGISSISTAKAESYTSNNPLSGFIDSAVDAAKNVLDSVMNFISSLKITTANKDSYYKSITDRWKLPDNQIPKDLT